MSHASVLAVLIYRFLAAVGGERTPEALAQALGRTASQVSPLLEDGARQGVLRLCCAGPVRYALCGAPPPALPPIQPAVQPAVLENAEAPCAAVFLAWDQGRPLAACELLVKHIEDLLDRSRAAGAVLCLELALLLLREIGARPEKDVRRYVDLALAAADISMYLTKFHQETRSICRQARAAALSQGDMRNGALLQLLDACLENMAGECAPRRVQELRRSCEDSLRGLGDSDFRARVCYFMGMFDFWQGNFQQVLQSAAAAQLQSQLWQCRFQKEMFPLYTSSSALYLGRTHQAVGILEAARRTAELAQDAFKTMWWEAQLALVLLYMGRDEEALGLLDHVIANASPESETKILHWGMRGLAYYHYRRGNIRASHTILRDTMRVSLANGFRRLPYSNPWIFDMLAAYALAGLPPIEGFTLEEETERALEGSNRHLRAAALRARALLLRGEGAPRETVESVLGESLREFRAVGNMLELARTRDILSQGRTSQTEAPRRRAARKDAPQPDAPVSPLTDPETPAAPHAVSDALPHASSPDGPPHGLAAPLPHPDEVGSLEHNCRVALHSIQALQDFGQFVNQMTYIASCELGAERAALLHSEGDGAVRVEAACNMSPAELDSGHLASRLARVLNALGGTPLLLEDTERTALILPLMDEDFARWTLYMESTYAVHSLQSMDAPTQEALLRLFSSELRAALRLRRAQAVSVAEGPELARTEPYRDSPQALLHGSPLTRRVLSHARQLSATGAPVLILGETGVGKELLARYIHDCSGRSGAFVPVHPASIPDGLFESEFFGHEKGSFTGAHKRKIGLAELADKGTLFIDEVGDIPAPMQVKLLRVFQDQRFLRVGGNSEICSEFRLVGATNKDLWQEVQEGRFREDLYYRMSVVPLTLPPLRERREDISVLAHLFLDRYSRRYHRAIPAPGEADLAALLDYPWPGNVRELKSVVERAVILHREGPLHFDLPARAERNGNGGNGGSGAYGGNCGNGAYGGHAGNGNSPTHPHGNGGTAPAGHAGAPAFAPGGHTSHGMPPQSGFPQPQGDTAPRPGFGAPPLATHGNPAEGWPSMDELQARYIRQVLELTNGRITGPRGALKILGMKRSTLYARMKQYGIG